MTYTRDLKELIKCSGFAATAGQSFRSNVAGAVSGAKMSDYILTGWNWTGGPASPLHYNSGEVFSMTGNFLGGSRIGNIIAQGAGRLVVTPGYVGNGGSVTLNSSSISSSTSSASITVVSPYNPGTPPALVGSATWYYNGSDQTAAPTTGYCQAHFSARVTGGGGIGDGNYEDVTFTLSFPNVNAGTGHFNPDPPSILYTASMYHRGRSLSDFTCEWHSNSTYTNYVSGSFDYYPDESVFAPSTPPNPYSLWLRYKETGDPTWTNYGQVDFNDGRLTY